MTSKDTFLRRPRNAIGLALVIAGGLALFWGGIAYVSRELPTTTLVERATTAFREQQYDQAQAWADRALRVDPENPAALLVAGQSSAAKHEFNQALRYLEEIPDDAGAVSQSARLECGEILLTHLRRPSEAEAQYRRLLEFDPANVAGCHRLAYLLGIGGRTWDAIPYRLQLIKSGHVEPINLYLLCRGETILENVDQVAVFHEASPEDPLPLLGLARQAIDRQDEATAEQLLRRLIERHPNDAAAHVKLGEILLQTHDDAGFRGWYADLPADARRRPDYWSVIGTWAEEHQQPSAAMRCFWEAIRIDPNRQAAVYQLGQSLTRASRERDAEPFLSRSQQLERYFTAVTSAWSGTDMAAVKQAAVLAESLGLLWEAHGWCRLMLDYRPQTPWAARMINRLAIQLPEMPLQRSVPHENPALSVDLSGDPLPSIGTEEMLSPDRSLVEKSATTIRFTDEAAVAGLEFTFFNGAPRDRQTRRMYEFNGGGVAVADYDGDGRPDVYLTQGTPFSQSSDVARHSDRLYRNMTSRHFTDVTANACATDDQFSAGATVGDYDNDGFPDLYVANIGGNRFLMNNGDGTFRDVTERTGTAGEDWSSSCVLADLNGDGLPDLYVVNYLSGPDVFTRICASEQGRLRSCSPRQFAAAQDRLYINVGDGTFQDATVDSGIRATDGKGLGVVALDCSGKGRLDLFVANDAVPNFFFRNTGASADAAPLYVEQGLLSGAALNNDGNPEACMGVAAGDADGDGRTDLFVTNFHNESNTLYRQQTAGMFSDATRLAGLFDPSMKMLGFGTQFIDADLDGDLDLIVANGHIDDLTEEGTAYQMPPQVFENGGAGRFAPLESAEVGAYFEGEYLGRGLARLDWNRDGLEDVVISHLDAPAALLTNVASDPGNSLRLSLRGTNSSRDAIGSEVTIRMSNGGRLVRQLTAGDGFQASNERRLVIGLGGSTDVDTVSVRWPSGLVREYRQPPVNTELLLLESTARWLPIPVH